MGSELWSSRPYRALFGAQTISRWGDTFNQVALVVLVFQLTGSGLRVAGTVAFEITPVLLLGPLAGAAADRLPKRRVMVGADLARALVALALVLGPHHLALVYAAAFGLAGGSVFFGPAAGALLPVIVGRRELVGANSALWTAAVASQIVLAPVAGALVAALGPRPAFAVNAASFLGSALLLRGLPPGAPAPGGLREGTASTSDPSAPPSSGGGWGQSVLQGVGLLRSDPLVRLLAMTQGLAALSAGATSALLVVLAQRRLGLGPSGFGGLLSAIGIGAVAGPLLFRLARRHEVSAGWLFGPYALRGVVDLVLAATERPLVAAAALAAYGVGTSTGMVAYQTLVQSRLSPEVRGRAFAVLDVIWQGARLCSLGAGGLLADAVGIRAVYVAGGVLLLAAAAAGACGAKAARL